MSETSLPEGLPTEQVDGVPVLGTVTVRGATLSELLADEFAFGRAVAGATAGADAADTRIQATAEMTLKRLARQVVDGDGKPVMTRAQWEIYGGRHMSAAGRIYAAIERLTSPTAEDVEKN